MAGCTAFFDCMKIRCLSYELLMVYPVSYTHLECEKAGRECDFKVIYGVEAYLVDDLKDMIVNPKGCLLYTSRCV